MDPQIKSNISTLNPSLDFHSIQDRIEPISPSLAKSIDKVDQVGEDIIHASTSEIANNSTETQQFPHDIFNSYHSAKLQKDLLNELNGSNTDDLNDLDMDFDMDLIEEDNNSIESLQIVAYQEDSQINEDNSLENIEKEELSQINIDLNEKTEINENKENIENSVASEINTDAKLEEEKVETAEIKKATEARIDTITSRADIVTLGEKVVSARIANVYLVDPTSIKNIDTSKLSKLTDDLDKGSAALKTKMFMEVDFTAKRAYVPRGSNIPEGTEIEVDSVKLIVTYMTEDQEKSLLEGWDLHVTTITSSIEPETKQEVQEKKPEETKHKEIKKGIENDIPMRNGKEKEIAGGWADNHSFVLFNLNSDAAKVEHRKSESAALKDDIKKEEDQKEIRKEHIRKDAKAADALKQNIMLENQRYHNHLAVDHHLVMIPRHKAD
ncbi:MAG: hypothetical protein ACXU9U_03405 [Parachlamydiaceae bacterium]